jgi:hypothetical protein
MCDLLLLFPRSTEVPLVVALGLRGRWRSEWWGIDEGACGGRLRYEFHVLLSVRATLTMCCWGDTARLLCLGSLRSVVVVRCSRAVTIGVDGVRGVGARADQGLVPSFRLNILI